MIKNNIIISTCDCEIPVSFVPGKCGPAPDGLGRTIHPLPTCTALRMQTCTAKRTEALLKGRCV